MSHEPADLDWNAGADQDWAEAVVPAAAAPVAAAASSFAPPPAADDWAAEVAQEQWSGQPQVAPASTTPNWGGSSNWD